MSLQFRSTGIRPNSSLPDAPGGASQEMDTLPLLFNTALKDTFSEVGARAPTVRSRRSVR